MNEAITIKDTPLNEAIEEARKLLESKGYAAEITGIEKCYITGYEDMETEMTELTLITCLDNEKHLYRVYSNLIKKAAKELDLEKPVWVLIFRLNIGLVVVGEILEHTDQLELLFQQMKANLNK